MRRSPKFPSSPLFDLLRRVCCALCATLCCALCSGAQRTHLAPQQARAARVAPHERSKALRSGAQPLLKPLAQGRSAWSESEEEDDFAMVGIAVEGAVSPGAVSDEEPHPAAASAAARYGAAGGGAGPAPCRGHPRMALDGALEGACRLLLPLPCRAGTALGGGWEARPRPQSTSASAATIVDSCTLPGRRSSRASQGGACTAAPAAAAGQRGLDV